MLLPAQASEQEAGSTYTSKWTFNSNIYSGNACMRFLKINAVCEFQELWGTASKMANCKQFEKKRFPFSSFPFHDVFMQSDWLLFSLFSAIFKASLSASHVPMVQGCHGSHPILSRPDSSANLDFNYLRVPLGASVSRFSSHQLTKKLPRAWRSQQQWQNVTNLCWFINYEFRIATAMFLCSFLHILTFVSKFNLPIAPFLAPATPARCHPGRLVLPQGQAKQRKRIKQIQYPLMKIWFKTSKYFKWMEISIQRQPVSRPKGFAKCGNCMSLWTSCKKGPHAVDYHSNTYPVMRWWPKHASQQVHSCVLAGLKTRDVERHWCSATLTWRAVELMSCNVSSSCHPHIHLLRILLAVDCLSMLGYYPMYSSQRILPMLTKFLVAKITAATRENRKHIRKVASEKVVLSTSLHRARLGFQTAAKPMADPRSSTTSHVGCATSLPCPYRSLPFYWGHQLVLVAVNHIDP